MKKFFFLHLTFKRSLLYLARLSWRELKNIRNLLSVIISEDAIWISPGVEIVCDNKSIMHVESGVSIGRGTVINVCEFFLGVGNLKASDEKILRLKIGSGTYIGENNNIRAAGASIEIGANCMISQMVTIVSSNHGVVSGVLMMHQPWQVPESGITIGDDVWIGAGAVILPGVTIKSGAIIAAGAVVTRHVDANMIMAGIPARPIGIRS